MSYNRKNYLSKRRHAVMIAKEHYEPGRHDRCYKWVWKKYIKHQFHIEYRTLMKWIREEEKEASKEGQLTLF